MNIGLKEFVVWLLFGVGMVFMELCILQLLSKTIKYNTDNSL